MIVPRWFDRATKIILLAAFLHALFCQTLGFWNPILDSFPFRQTQTAYTAYTIAEGGPWLRYLTPVLGGPWSIPFEFPSYQLIAAALHVVTGLPLDQSGRVTSSFFFFATPVPLASILTTGGVSAATVRLGLSFFLTAPLSLFLSRTFMIESTALFFSVVFVAAIVHPMRRSRPGATATETCLPYSLVRSRR